MKPVKLIYHWWPIRHTWIGAITLGHHIFFKHRRGEVPPGLLAHELVRLNAGIYRIVSTYGDANATVEADVTVEAGKLSEASVTHSAAAEEVSM